MPSAPRSVPAAAEPFAPPGSFWSECLGLQDRPASSLTSVPGAWSEDLVLTQDPDLRPQPPSVRLAIRDPSGEALLELERSLVQERGFSRRLGPGPHAELRGAGTSRKLRLVAQVFRPVALSADPPPSLASIYLADEAEGAYVPSRWDDLVVLERGTTPIAHMPAQAWRPRAANAGAHDRSGTSRASWLDGEALADLEFGVDGQVVAALTPQADLIARLTPTEPSIAGFHERSRSVRVVRRDEGLLAAYFVLGTFQHKHLAAGVRPSPGAPGGPRR